MRTAFAALLLLITGTATASAQAVPEYPWCAMLGGDAGGGTSCWFTTLEQCRATVSGVGGYCMQNPAYTGGGPPARRGRPRG
jgi:hypothetical protein